jgi:hypothetical protein
MDRRLVVPTDPVLGGDTLFQQIRGGRYGIGHGLALTIEANKPGSFTDLGISMAQFAQGVGFALEVDGILTTKHGPTCGAIEGATSIHNGVAGGEEDAAMFSNVSLFKPDITEKEYGKVVAAAQRINAAKLNSTPGQIKRVLTTPSTVQWRTDIAPTPAPHVELEDTRHEQIMFVADYRKDRALDRRLAQTAGYGAYYSSFGALEEILQAVPEPVSEIATLESWFTTEAVILGRVATHDITNGGTPYPIEAIGR